MFRPRIILQFSSCWGILFFEKTMKTNTGGGGQLFTLPSEGRGWAGYFLLSSPTLDLNHGDSLMRGGYMIDHVC